ncbi:MAG TPA: hypothetical protein V6C72_04755, partial [Chroococcales cyanobacterium]
MLLKDQKAGNGDIGEEFSEYRQETDNYQQAVEPVENYASPVEGQPDTGVAGDDYYTQPESGLIPADFVEVPDQESEEPYYPGEESSDFSAAPQYAGQSQYAENAEFSQPAGDPGYYDQGYDLPPAELSAGQYQGADYQTPENQIPSPYGQADYSQGEYGHGQQDYGQQEYGQQDYGQQEYAQQEYAQHEYADQSYPTQESYEGEPAGSTEGYEAASAYEAYGQSETDPAARYAPGDSPVDAAGELASTQALPAEQSDYYNGLEGATGIENAEYYAPADQAETSEPEYGSQSESAQAPYYPDNDEPEYLASVSGAQTDSAAADAEVLPVEAAPAAHKETVQAIEPPEKTPAAAAATPSASAADQPAPASPDAVAISSPVMQTLPQRDNIYELLGVSQMSSNQEIH